jgi:hypothetical protein
MSTRQKSLHDPRMTEAVRSLQTLISSHYPTATFRTFHGEDPDGVYLRTAVDLDDPDVVMDLAIDRLLKYQLDEGLPVYLLPVRTEARIAAEVAKRGSLLRVPATPFPVEPNATV